MFNKLSIYSGPLVCRINLHQIVSMNEFAVIKFVVTDKYYGCPQPFIPDGTVVILMQEGRIELSRYIEPTIENPTAMFDHPGDPLVNKELEQCIFDIIKEKYPHHLLPDKSVVLSCPLSVAEKIVW